MDHPDRTVRAGRTSDPEWYDYRSNGSAVYQHWKGQGILFTAGKNGGTGQISRYRKKMCAGSIAWTDSKRKQRKGFKTQMADAGGDIFLLCTVHVFCNRGMDQHGNDHLAARNGRSISVYADPV